MKSPPTGIRGDSSKKYEKDIKNRRLQMPLRLAIVGHRTILAQKIFFATGNREKKMKLTLNCGKIAE